MHRFRFLLPVLLVALMFGMTEIAQAANPATVTNNAPCKVKIAVASDNGTIYPEVSVLPGGVYTVKLLTAAERVVRIKINGVWFAAPYTAVCTPLPFACPTLLCYSGGQNWAVF